jgi:hypothetical protein
MLLQQIKKREIALLIGILDHIMKVSDWLMIMENKDKTNSRVHVRSSPEAKRTSRF